MRRLKIAYVITRSDEIGGAHIHVRDLAKWMIAQGHEVCVFVGGEGPYIDLLKTANVPFQQLKKLKRDISPYTDLIAIRELSKVISVFDPDVVSLHSAKAGLLGRFACRNLAYPVVFTAHGWSFATGISFLSRYLYRFLERIAAPMADIIITVCETDKRFALNNKVADKNTIIAIHNGMPDIDINFRATPTNPTAKIVMVARFEKQKDHITLLKALAELKNYDWELLLVGEGPLITTCQQIVRENGIEDKVQFLGRRNDVPKILSQADIYVLTSFWEGFPRSILEAMRASLPVVATRVAGVPEAVIEGETGYLVETGNQDQLAKKLGILLEEPALRKKLGENARSLYEKEFTFERMASKTLKVYEDLRKQH